MEAASLERFLVHILTPVYRSEAAAKRNIQRNITKKDSRKRKDPGFLYVPFRLSFS
jgi:hypothetical protein